MPCAYPKFGAVPPGVPKCMRSGLRPRTYATSAFLVSEHGGAGIGNRHTCDVMIVQAQRPESPCTLQEDRKTTEQRPRQAQSQLLLDQPEPSSVHRCDFALLRFQQRRPVRHHGQVQPRRVATGERKEKPLAIPPGTRGEDTPRRHEQ